MPKRKSGRHAAETPSGPEVVCILILEVDMIGEEFEVEICCERCDGVDRVFSPSIDWLRAERPSESTLVNSVEVLLFSVVSRCRFYIGEPVNVRAGLLSKEHVEGIISSARLKMDEIQKENEGWREAEIVAKADRLGLLPKASYLSSGIWIASCPGTNHTLEMQPMRNLFYCGYCRVGGGIGELHEFVAQRRSTAAGIIGRRTSH